MLRTVVGTAGRHRRGLDSGTVASVGGSRCARQRRAQRHHGAPPGRLLPSVRAAKPAAPFLAPSGATGVLVATDAAGPLAPADLSAIEVMEDRAL